MKAKPSEILIRMINVLKQHPGGLTFGQVRKELNLRPEEQGQLDRRKRELYEWYVIEKVRRGRDVFYIYRGDRPKPLERGAVSRKLRAEVLNRAHGRCEMCGRTIQQHDITLEVDHKIPRNWGGRPTLDNLWALCQECNTGKKNYFDSQDQMLMRKVMQHKSVHVRIGELLKANFRKAVPSHLIAFVAGQDDWKKRTRELRYLGWKIRSSRTKSRTGKVESQYSLSKFSEWPANPTRWIREYEKKRAQRGRQKRVRATDSGSS